ncbi:MAG: hypothetical protein KatS3mg083_625 [Candidatus Dojkabacteria bacterium]|nr:MAG: hypothetical protein KatS3mg083_625 [Candidatus Dojkabacteria bacterium]
MFDARLPFVTCCDSMFIPYSPLKLIFGDVYSSKNFNYLSQLYYYRNIYGQKIFRYIIGSNASRCSSSLFIDKFAYGFTWHFSYADGMLPVAIGLFKYRDFSEVKFGTLNTVGRVVAYRGDIIFFDLASGNGNESKSRVGVQPLLGHYVVFDAPIDVFEHKGYMDCTYWVRYLEAIDYTLSVRKQKESVRTLFYCSFTIDNLVVEVHFVIRYQKTGPVFATRLVFPEQLYKVYGDWLWGHEYRKPIKTFSPLPARIYFDELDTEGCFYGKIFSFVLGREYNVHVRGMSLDNFTDILLNDSEELCKRVHKKFKRGLTSRGAKVGSLEVIRCG